MRQAQYASYILHIETYLWLILQHSILEHLNYFQVYATFAHLEIQLLTALSIIERTIDSIYGNPIVIDSIVVRDVKFLSTIKGRSQLHFTW